MLDKRKPLEKYENIYGYVYVAAHKLFLINYFKAFLKTYVGKGNGGEVVEAISDWLDHWDQA